MSAFVLSPTARRDLQAIWRYIAKDSFRYADLVEDAVFETCRAAAKLPALGHRRHEIPNPDLRFLAVPGYPRYSIAYLAGSSPLRVLRIVHGARDVPRLFL